MATALVTGGTSGIGAAFARALAARGDDLVLVARDAERLASMATEITDRFAVQVEVMAADLSQREDVERVAARLASTEQPVELLVNNAGFQPATTLTAADLSAQERAIEVMVRAVLMLGGAAGRAMRDRGRGAIINVSSTSGYIAMDGYSAVKAWARTYSEALAVELAGTGVTVTALCPGWVRTEFHQRARIKVAKIPESLWLDADDVVAEGLRDSARGRVVSIPSRRYKVLMFLTQHVPRSLVRAVSARISSSRH